MNFMKFLKAAPKGDLRTQGESGTLEFKHGTQLETRRLSESLKNMSRPDLINKIIDHERKQSELITHINSLNVAINNGYQDTKRGEETNEKVSLCLRRKAATISQRFDELFNVLSQKD